MLLYYLCYQLAMCILFHTAFLDYVTLLLDFATQVLFVLLSDVHLLVLFLDLNTVVTFPYTGFFFLNSLFFAVPCDRHLSALFSTLFLPTFLSFPLYPSCPYIISIYRWLALYAFFFYGGHKNDYSESVRYVSINFNKLIAILN